jgi:DNA polymerase III alpha subunit
MSAAFVITRDRLDEVIPIENAAMEDRTMVEWDKDDLEALGHPEDRHPGARHADLHP